MIQDLRWEYSDKGEKVLRAYDGHVWFDIPVFKTQKQIETNENMCKWARAVSKVGGNLVTGGSKA